LFQPSQKGKQKHITKNFAALHGNSPY